MRSYSQLIPKGDELPIMVSATGGSGPARAWGHVKKYKLVTIVLRRY